MYMPKDIHKRLKDEARLAGRLNADGMVVAPIWSKLFLQASYFIKRKEREITRLRAENERLRKDIIWLVNEAVEQNRAALKGDSNE